MRKRSVGQLLVLVLLLTSACDYLPALPRNPFRVTSTPDAGAMSAPVVFASPMPSPTATGVPFAPLWVRNHRPTEMWSGPPDRPGVISFGTTSGQFCAFQVMEPQTSSRLHVLNPYSRDYFWIDADAVGPVAEAPRRAAEPKPPDQNCAEAIYDG